MDLDQGQRFGWVTRAKQRSDRLGPYNNLNEVRVIDGYTHTSSRVPVNSFVYFWTEIKVSWKVMMLSTIPIMVDISKVQQHYEEQEGPEDRPRNKRHGFNEGQKKQVCAPLNLKGRKRRELNVLEFNKNNTKYRDIFYLS